MAKRKEPEQDNAEKEGEFDESSSAESSSDDVLFPQDSLKIPS